MGVNRSDYILIGANLEVEMHEDFFDEHYDEYFSRRNHKVGKIAYLDDGYNGEYFVVGIPLKIDKDGYDGLGLTEISFSKNTKEHILYFHQVKTHIQEKFNQNVEPKIIVLTHWT